jgi:putative hydrolase of HD superfamily
MTKDIGKIVDFLFEVGILAETPRSGFYFLGSGKQSVAEHICRDIFIGYVLAQMEEDGIDAEKVLKMCLFHDLAEARTNDLNYVHQKYARADEKKAIRDVAATVPFGKDVKALINEYRARKTREAKLAKDADNIEWILSLKEQADTGNARAKTWIPSAVKRLKTKSAQRLARQIIKTDSDHWWFADKDDEWWVNRRKK